MASTSAHVARASRSRLLAIASLLAVACSTAPEASDCALFCDSWYECSTTSGMAPSSGSCDFPNLSAEQFRALCEPKCEAIAATLTTGEVSDTVECLECMLGRVAPSQCTNVNVAEAANGPCSTICEQPGPDRFMDEIGADAEINAECRGE